MSKPFRLSLSHVECRREQAGEWGKDEMYLLGFGISSLGHRVAIPPTSIGSYHSGDQSGQNGFPKLMVDTQVPDNEDLVAMCFWLYERDGGSLSNNGESLRIGLNQRVTENLTRNAQLQLPEKSANLYAFAQSMVFLRETMIGFSDGAASDDEIFFCDFVHITSRIRQPGPGSHPTFLTSGGGHGASYILTFEYEFDRTPVVATL